MDKEELKKSVAVNLRCVTQSSKGGVNLNSLQNEYKSLIGKPIPFIELGYSTLESFLLSVPDVVCLKKHKNGLCMVEAVADSSTVHIANLISKQKNAKGVKKGTSLKPAKPVRKYPENWRSSLNNPEGFSKVSPSVSFNVKIPLPKPNTKTNTSIAIKQITNQDIVNNKPNNSAPAIMPTYTEVTDAIVNQNNVTLEKNVFAHSNPTELKEETSYVRNFSSLFMDNSSLKESSTFQQQDKTISHSLKTNSGSKEISTNSDSFDSMLSHLTIFVHKLQEKLVHSFEISLTKGQRRKMRRGLGVALEVLCKTEISMNEGEGTLNSVMVYSSLFKDTSFLKEPSMSISSFPTKLCNQQNASTSHSLKNSMASQEFAPNSSLVSALANLKIILDKANERLKNSEIDVGENIKGRIKRTLKFICDIERAVEFRVQLNENQVNDSNYNVTKISAINPTNVNVPLTKPENVGVGTSTTIEITTNPKNVIPLPTVLKANSPVPALKSNNCGVTNSIAQQKNFKSELSNNINGNPTVPVSNVAVINSLKESKIIPSTLMANVNNQPISDTSPILKNNEALEERSPKLSGVESTLSEVKIIMDEANEGLGQFSGSPLTKSQRKSLRKRIRKAEKHLSATEISLKEIKEVGTPNFMNKNQVSDSCNISAAEIEDLKNKLENEKKINKSLSYQNVLLHTLVKIGQESLAVEVDKVKKLEKQLKATLKTKTNGTTNIALESPGKYLPPSIRKEQLKNITVMNLQTFLLSRKDGVLLNALEREYQNLFGMPIPYKELKYKSLEAFVQDIPDVINLKMKKDGQIHIQASDVEAADIFNEFFCQCDTEPIPPPVAPTTVLPSFYQREPSFSSFQGVTVANAAFKPSLNCFPKIKNSIANAQSNSLLMLNLLMFADDSYKETLKRGILSFDGFDFCEGSDKWKERKILFTMQSEDTLQECLNLLCIDFKSNDKKELVMKLLQFLASPSNAMLNSNIDTKISEKDFRKETIEINNTASSSSNNCALETVKQIQEHIHNQELKTAAKHD